MTQRVALRDFSAVIRRRLSMDLRVAQEAALEACTFAKREARRLTKRDGLIFTEHYYDSFYARPTPKGAVIGNEAPYAMVIEKGRRPNRPGPPLAPIEAWVNGKLGITGAEGRSAAFAIRKKIHEKGTPPHNILQQASFKLKQYHRDACQRRLRRRGAA